MNKQFLISISIFFSILSCQPHIPNSSEEITVAKNDTLFSKILKENRELLIHIPREFHSAYPPVSYPVLYVLDPEAHFLSLVGMVERMSTNSAEEICPPMIVVGVQNTHRVRDMFPIQEEDRFHEFLETELIPYIDENYPTQPYRVLFGHSISGLRTVHTAIFHRNLFNAYIAIDPSFCHQYCRWWKKYPQQRENFELGDNRMFLAMAHTMGDKDTTEIRLDTSGRATHMNSMMEFAEKMLKKNKEKQTFTWKYYPEYSHSGVTLQASLDGLEQIFSWFKNESLDILYSENSSPTQAFQAYSSHFQQVSSELGYEYLPPEAQVSMLVEYLYRSKKRPDKALPFAEMNVKNYPSSEYPQVQLAELRRALINK